VLFYDNGKKSPNGLSADKMSVLLTHSGGASAVKEPGQFKVKIFSSQVTQMQFFPQKKLTTFLFLGVALKTQAANAVSPSK